jgi:hypothetical protein
MGQETIEPEELLERLRREQEALRWAPLAPSDGLAEWRKWPVRSDLSLDHLHHHWVLPHQFDPSTAGASGGVKAKLIRIFGRLVFRVLGPYLREERELLSHMVRMNDALARRCDEITLEITRRETSQAKNEARLAAWLHEALGPNRDWPGGSPA